MAVNLRCPGCHQKFPWNTKAGWPRFCPLCAYDTSMDGNPEVAAPHVSAGRAKALSQSADQTYRQIENGSADRAALASEITGVDSSDLKITDLKDNLQYGEIAVKEIHNEVSNLVKAAPNVFGFRDGQNGSGFAAAAHTGTMPSSGQPIRGDVPHAGLRVANRVAEFHTQKANSIVRSSETGRF